MVQTLSYDDVIAIHNRVIADFADEDDPVGIAGPRDDGRLLESVLGRQHVGFGGVMKYPDPHYNAATLTFGICCGHPFHNGNKRTALVSMLAHLDANGMTIFGVRKKELYGMIKQVAEHGLGLPRPDPRKKNQVYSAREAEDEVDAIASWLKDKGRKFERGERDITYRQLRRILLAHGLTVEQPKNMNVGIYREVMVKRLLRKSAIEKQRVITIPWPGDGKSVGMKQIKAVRRAAGLDAPSGCDTHSFYEHADMVDVFINEYRDILSKLARQ
jgi:death-on-curing family protein